jgi:hypothetical protein
VSDTVILSGGASSAMNTTPIGDKLPEVYAKPAVPISAQTSLFTWLAGRTTTFLAFFTLTGFGLHLFHRLDGTYLGFIGVIMGFVLGHSVKEDIQANAAKPSAGQ